VLRVTCCRAAPVATLAVVESWQVDVLALAYQHEFVRTRRASVIAVGHLPTLKCAVQHNRGHRWKALAIDRDWLVGFRYPHGHGNSQDCAINYTQPQQIQERWSV
jgi:hypothetical protein